MSDNHDDDRDENVGNDDQMPADDETDYDVGYRKPPKAGQFRPGQSGNPKGRKKRSRGLKTDLGAELRSKVPVTENGKTKQLTKQQLLIKALVTKAAKGDTKAAAQVLSMTMHMFGVEDQRADKATLSAMDAALLDSFLEHEASIYSTEEDELQLEADAGGAGNHDGNGNETTQSEDESNDKEEPDNGSYD